MPVPFKSWAWTRPLPSAWYGSYEKGSGSPGGPASSPSTLPYTTQMSTFSQLSRSTLSFRRQEGLSKQPQLKLSSCWGIFLSRRKNCKINNNTWNQTIFFIFLGLLPSGTTWSWVVSLFSALSWRTTWSRSLLRCRKWGWSISGDFTFCKRITPKFSGRALKYLLVKSQIDFGLRILLV